MRFLFVIIFISAGLVGCKNNNKIPDVSDIKIELTTQRFEKDLFSSDSLQLPANLDKLIARYPSFGENFLTTILNTDPHWAADSATAYIISFISAYRPLYDSSQKLFSDFSPYEKQIKKATQYLHYYFPSYAIPKKIITYIGPLDGFGDILDTDAFIVGLHQHLGSNFSLYKTELVRNTYPDYISNRFQMRANHPHPKSTQGTHATRTQVGIVFILVLIWDGGDWRAFDTTKKTQWEWK